MRKALPLSVCTIVAAAHNTTVEKVRAVSRSHRIQDSLSLAIRHDIGKEIVNHRNSINEKPQLADADTCYRKIELVTTTSIMTHVAKKFGVSVSYVDKIVKGERPSDYGKAKRIVQEFEFCKRMRSEFYKTIGFEG